jgi:prolyl oligopeptidase
MSILFVLIGKLLLQYTGSRDGVFYFRTDKNAPNYRLIGVYLDNPDEKYWSTLLPEHPTDVLDWAHPING